MMRGGGDALAGLVIDVGNTRLRVSGWRGGRQDPRTVGLDPSGSPVAGEALRTLGSWETPPVGATAAAVAKLEGLREAQPGLPVALVCVVPRMEAAIRAVWPEVAVVDHRSPLPFEPAVEAPERVGPDRLCNMAGAAAAGCANALVVDAGTATTFDLLLDGKFVGGLIAPGMALAASALAASTARLNPVLFASCPFEVGRDTEAALRAGAFHVGLAGVEATLARLVGKYGPLPVVVTGGLGHLLAKPGRLFDRDWTLRGAAVLAGLPAAD